MTITVTPKLVKPQFVIFFQGGIHKNPATILEKLKEIGICVPANKRFFPYFACYTGQQKNSFFKREQEHSFLGNIEVLIPNLALVFF